MQLLLAKPDDFQQTNQPILGKHLYKWIITASIPFSDVDASTEKARRGAIADFLLYLLHSLMMRPTGWLTERVTGRPSESKKVNRHNESFESCSAGYFHFQHSAPCYFHRQQDFASSIQLKQNSPTNQLVCVCTFIFVLAEGFPVFLSTQPPGTIRWSPLVDTPATALINSFL